jgi:glycosyltransferase involved in cell wall biosynthesis
MSHVVFIHLDLGIGGAESLILNLAKATLPSSQTPNDSSPSGTVSIYTTHCSPTHCYDEVKPPDGPLAPFVRIRGRWIPRNFSLGGTALCSALRMLYLTYCAVKENPNANVFVLDVLPTGVPYLIAKNVKAGVLFYCHFPDKLLTRDTVNGESSLPNETNTTMQTLKRTYRWCLDSTEEWTMNFSDLIVVNSRFTMAEVQKVFPALFANNGNGIEETERVKVLYPAIESSLSKVKDTDAINNNIHNGESVERGLIVSLNRFERKKNISLLLHAYALLLEKAELGNIEIKLPPLIIAGGYDPLNIENVEHLAELRVLADQILARFNMPPSVVVSSSKSESMEAFQVDTSIAFYPSVSNEKRSQLLSSAAVWCYTPHREHFGIVPLEAMDAGVPVVGIRSGGPMETIVDGVTGYLVDYAPIELDDYRNNVTVRGFADAIANILLDPEKARAMGHSGKERVHEFFGMETFRKQWWELLDEAQTRGNKRHSNQIFTYPKLIHTVLWCLIELGIVFLFAVILTWLLSAVGLIEENKGIFGTVKFHYLKLIGGEEL